MTGELREAGGGLVVDVVPPSPYRLPGGRGPDQVSRVNSGVWERYLRVGRAQVLLRAWHPRERGRRTRSVRIAAIPVAPGWEGADPDAPQAGAEELAAAIARARVALCVDDDYSEFFRRFRGDPFLGPAIRRRPDLRARRSPWGWEALAWAITEQLIEVERAHAIQRRIVARWGCRVRPPDRPRALACVPGPGELAALAPAELVGCDLAPKRALAMIKVAREVAAGRIDPDSARDDRRLLAISEIGPWTVQCLGLKGRGDPDSLPAGDLAYLKLVPRLVGMDRRATVAEVEEFYAPYAPFRGLAGLFSLVGHGLRSEAQKPLRYHPPRPELEAA